jgi:hypothetical protein
MIFDYKKDFLQAAVWYHSLSLSPSIDRHKCLIVLTNAIKCTILSSFNVSRSKLISELFKNDKAKQSSAYFMLNFLYVHYEDIFMSVAVF